MDTSEEPSEDEMIDLVKTFVTSNAVEQQTKALNVILLGVHRGDVDLKVCSNSYARTLFELRALLNPIFDFFCLFNRISFAFSART